MQAPIMLTLETSSLSAKLDSGKGSMSLAELPKFAVEETGLRGLAVAASLLAGRSAIELDQFRDAADKVGCPCLSLTDPTPLSLAGGSNGDAEASLDRVKRLAAAAARLGCSSLAIVSDAPKGCDLDAVAMGIRAAVQAIERHELNLLLTPSDRGELSTAEGLIELIRRVGGFRIGCMPTFAHAAGTVDPNETLRRLAPYAGAMIGDLDATSPRRGGPDLQLLATWVRTVRTVGFASTLALGSKARDAVARISAARDHLETAAAAGDEDEAE